MPETRKEPLDFREIFYKRLAEITIFSEEEGKSEAWDLTEAGITWIKRRGWAVIFAMGTKSHTDATKFDLWIADPESIKDSRFPHFEVVEQLKDFTDIKDARLEAYLSAEVVEDNQNKIHVLIDPLRSLRLRKDIKNRNYKKPFVDLIKEYGLVSMIGSISDKAKGWKTKKFLDLDLMSTQREKRGLWQLARTHQMTNFQYMRFRILAISALEAEIPYFSRNKLAQEVIEFDKF